MIFKNIKKNKRNTGMSYVELIVVLSIFSIVTGTVIFNYQSFQAKVDLKSLVNDVALKFVEAQKNSAGGKIPVGKIILQSPPLPVAWKPSYGLFFHIEDVDHVGPKAFYYFTDLDQNKKFNEEIFECPFGECIEKFIIQNDYYLDHIRVYSKDGSFEDVKSPGLSLTYTRPDFVLTVQKSTENQPMVNVDYVEIALIIPEILFTSKIQVYSSGRIEIK
jgi:type II secretory pathway pseudopilin PulG